VAEVADGAVYLALALRNVGNGLAVLDRWDFHPERDLTNGSYRSLDHFRRLTRDLYVPSGDIGFWQGTFRDRTDPEFEAACTAIADRRAMMVDLLYSDHEGGQHTVSRFSISRHWNLDRDDPR
jgi:hypothetical protein